MAELLGITTRAGSLQALEMKATACTNRAAVLAMELRLVGLLVTVWCCILFVHRKFHMGRHFITQLTDSWEQSGYDTTARARQWAIVCSTEIELPSWKQWCAAPDAPGRRGCDPKRRCFMSSTEDKLLEVSFSDYCFVRLS